MLGKFIGKNWSDNLPMTNRNCFAFVRSLRRLFFDFTVNKHQTNNFGRWLSAHIDLVDELVLHKDGYSRNNKYFLTVLNNMTLLCTKYYQNWSMSVEDIASQDWKTHFRGSWLNDSHGSAETLVGRGGITNYYLIAYFFSNTSAKNDQNRLMGIEVIVWNVSVVFWRHSVYAFWVLVGRLNCHEYTLCLKKIDSDVAHYNFNALQPILVIFGTDVYEGICY